MVTQRWSIAKVDGFWMEAQPPMTHKSPTVQYYYTTRYMITKHALLLERTRCFRCQTRENSTDTIVRRKRAPLLLVYLGRAYAHVAFLATREKGNGPVVPNQQ